MEYAFNPDLMMVEFELPDGTPLPDDMYFVNGETHRFIHKSHWVGPIYRWEE